MPEFRGLTPGLIEQLEAIVRNKFSPEIVAALDSVLSRYQQLFLMNALDTPRNLRKKRRDEGWVLRHRSTQKIEHGYHHTFVIARKSANHDDEVKKLETACRRIVALLQTLTPPAKRFFEETLPRKSAFNVNGYCAVQQWLEQVALVSLDVSQASRKRGRPVKSDGAINRPHSVRKRDSLSTWCFKLAKIFMVPSHPQSSAMSGSDIELLLMENISLEGITQWFCDLADSAKKAIGNGVAGRPSKDYRVDIIYDIGKIYQRVTGKPPGRSRQRKTSRPGHSFVDFASLCLFAVDGSNLKAEGVNALIRPRRRPRGNK